MNFWKFIVALICGVAVWFLIDNPYKNFVLEKERQLQIKSKNLEANSHEKEIEVQNEKQSIEKTYLLKEGSKEEIFGKDIKQDFDESDLKQKYDLYLGDCGSGDIKVAIVQSVLKTDMAQAKVFVESNTNSEVPFLTNLNILEAKAYKQAFTNAACDCKIDKTIY